MAFLLTFHGTYAFKIVILPFLTKKFTERLSNLLQELTCAVSITNINNLEKYFLLNNTF